MKLAVRGSRPRYGAGSPDQSRIATLLGHDFLSEAWAARRKKGGGGLSLTGARERRPRVNADTRATLPGFPPSKWKRGSGESRRGPGGVLQLSAQVCFCRQEPGRSVWIPGRSGWRAAGVFFLPEFSPCFPCTPSQCCGINFAFVNSFPCSVKCLSTSSLET